jgi:hypothetical protein
MIRFLLPLIAATGITSGFISFTAFANPAPFAPALETTPLGGNLWVSPSSTQSMPLPGRYYIKNLVIQAQAGSSDSTIEVMVNGQVKGTIEAPGRDPSYVVTIDDSARSIEFRHRSGGAMNIMVVVGTISRPGVPVYHGGRYSVTCDDIINLSSSALEQIENLRAFATPQDDQTYLSPIKTDAGLVYVMCTAHGDISKETITQLQALADQIKVADPYLNQLMLLDAAFDNVVQLLTVKETILSLLN